MVVPGGTASTSAAASREVMIAPKIATPNEPPIWRKNVADEVATPISRGEHGVLHGEHEHLHHDAEAEAEHEHAERDPPVRRVDG